MSSLVQMPSKSGWPHGSFGGAHLGLAIAAAEASAEALACASAGAAVAAPRIVTTPARRTRRISLLMSLDPDDAAADRLGDGGRAVVHVQLGVEVLHVHAGRVGADAERGGNLLVAHPLGHQLQYLPFALAQGRLARPLVERLLNLGRHDGASRVYLADDP